MQHYIICVDECDELFIVPHRPAPLIINGIVNGTFNYDGTLLAACSVAEMTARVLQQIVDELLTRGNLGHVNFDVTDLAACQQQIDKPGQDMSWLDVMLTDVVQHNEWQLFRTPATVHFTSHCMAKW